MTDRVAALNAEGPPRLCGVTGRDGFEVVASGGVAGYVSG